MRCPADCVKQRDRRDIATHHIYDVVVDVVVVDDVAVAVVTLTHRHNTVQPVVAGPMYCSIASDFCVLVFNWTIIALAR